MFFYTIIFIYVNYTIQVHNKTKTLYCIILNTIKNNVTFVVLNLYDDFLIL